MTQVPRAAAPLSGKDVLLLGAWFGLAAGMAELTVIAILEFGLDRLLFGIAPQMVWMTPLADLLVMSVAAIALWAVVVVKPGLIGWRTAVLVYALVAAALVLTYIEHRVHDLALAVLAIGGAVQLARMVAPRAERFRRLVRRTLPAMAGLIVVMGVSVHGWRAVAEKRALAALPEARAGAPNVLLIILDTVRSFNISLHGYERPTTPALERLAAQGTRFDFAMSTAPWTLPSHASMFTGRYPHELSASYLRPLDDTHPTLAEALRDQGFLTGGFVGNFNYAGWETGLARGFIRYEDFPMSFGQLLASSRLLLTLSNKPRIRALLGYDDVLGRKNAPAVNRGFLRWQAQHADRPFFAFLNYKDAHAPYLPPDPFATRFGPPRPHGDALLVQWMNEPNQWTETELQAEIDAYDGAIAYLDEQIESVLEELDRRGVLDNTVVIVTSDHGEEFGEHGFFGHGDYLYAQLLRVPLLVVHPERVPQGEAVATPVSLRDLPATVLDLVGLPAGEFPGASLARTWHAADTVAVPVLAVEGSRRAIVARGHHYIQSADGGEQLYDVVEDPFQRRDLAGSAEVVAELPWYRAAVRAVSGEPAAETGSAGLPAEGGPPRP